MCVRVNPSRPKGLPGALNIASVLPAAVRKQAESMPNPAPVRNAPTVETLGLKTDQYPDQDPCVLFVPKSDVSAKGIFKLDGGGVPVSAGLDNGTANTP